MINVHVLLVSASERFLEDWSASLKRAATAEPAGDSQRYRFHRATDVDSALEAVRDDGELQVVIVDFEESLEAEQLAWEIAACRPELDLFLALPRGSPVPQLPAELIDREEGRPERLLRQIQAAVNHRAATPFADTLRDYVFSARDAWHTPGHSGGDSLRGSQWVADWYAMMGEHIFNTDLSVSVQVLDSLLEPHSVIQEAQDLAAEAFGADHTFFVTNGTSTANKVIVQHLLGGGGKLILDQACHKSLHHSVVLFGVSPIYLRATVKQDFGFYGPVSQSEIFAAIDANPDAGLLVLTSCTYDGFYYDLEPIIEYAHARDIKVLVDEAWYAHGRFHPALRPNALECGADYVTQSTHKMLSAFSQASMIHVGDPDFDEARFREDLNMHTSTSPQYAMIASLDVARKQMSMEGYARLEQCLDMARRLREGLAATGAFRALTLADMLPDELVGDNVRLDPTKISIDVGASGLSARRVQLLLFERFGIQVEKITENTLTVLVTLGTTEGKLLRLLKALQELAAEARPASPVMAREGLRLPSLGAIEQLPRDAYFGASRLVPLRNAQGLVSPELVDAICADQIVPYPPGIPVLVPGQRISRDVLEYLAQLAGSDLGIEVHGLQEIDGLFCLRVSE